MQIRERTLYDCAAAMADIAEAEAFARLNKSAMAVSRLVELRCRLNGLLVDRIEVKTVDIGSALEEAKRRSSGVIQITATSVSVPEHETHRAHPKNPLDVFS